MLVNHLAYMLIVYSYLALKGKGATFWLNNLNPNINIRVVTILLKNLFIRKTYVQLTAPALFWVRPLVTTLALIRKSIRKLKSSWQPLSRGFESYFIQDLHLYITWNIAWKYKMPNSMENLELSLPSPQQNLSSVLNSVSKANKIAAKARMSVDNSRSLGGKFAK